MSTEATTHSQHDDFRAGRELGLNHVKLGMWFFIATEVMFFGGLIVTFLKYKLNNPAPEAALLDVTLVGLNTFLLLASSFTVVLGFDAIRQGDRAGLMRYLGVTILLGSAFLGGQIYEFNALYHEGVTLTGSLFGSTFFTLTGFHGLHVLIGVLWAGLTLVKAAQGKYSADDNLGVEIFGLYWHFVDVVWIALFTLIYLI